MVLEVNISNIAAWTPKRSIWNDVFQMEVGQMNKIKYGSAYIM